MLIWQQDQDGLLLFKKEIPLLLDIAPIRENVAGVEVRDYGLLYDIPWLGVWFYICLLYTSPSPRDSV